MEVNYLVNETNEAEISVDNATIAEIMRTELAKDSSVKFVAWKKNHPEEKPILSIKTSGKTVKKALKEATNSLDKELTRIRNELKKAK